MGHLVVRQPSGWRPGVVRLAHDWRLSGWGVVAGALGPMRHPIIPWVRIVGFVGF